MTHMMNRILFRHCRYLIVRPQPSGVIEDGGLYIEGGRIAAVGPSAEVEARCAAQEDLEIVDAHSTRSSCLAS